jgi:hypothetical protein
VPQRGAEQGVVVNDDDAAAIHGDNKSLYELGRHVDDTDHANKLRQARSNGVVERDQSSRFCKMHRT